MPKKFLRKRKLLSRDRSAHTAKRMCRASKSRNSRNCRLETESMKCQNFFFFFLNVSHMVFSSVLSFLLSTHSVDCAVPPLLSIHMLIVHFFFRSPR